MNSADMPPGQSIPLTGTGFAVYPRGDGVFEEHLDPTKGTIPGEILAMCALAEGMASGAPSIGILIRLPDGKQVIAQTSLKLLLTANACFLAVHGDPRT